MKLGFGAAALLFAGVGCESSNSTPPGQNNGYAGGNGQFGENPVQPGEHTMQRFNNSPDNSSADVQARDRQH